MAPTQNETDIVEVLIGPRLEAAWQECLLAWADAEPAERAACYGFAAAKRDALLRVLRDVTDPDEREAITAVCYIKLKSSWILLNTQAGYQIASGTIDGSLFCRAALLSALLGEIEPVLSRNDLDRITGFLSQPVDYEGNAAPTGLAAVLAPLDHKDNAPPPTPGGAALVVDPALLEAHIAALQQKIAKLEAERRQLADELGYNDVRDIIAMFHRLEGRAGLGTSASSSYAAPAPAPVPAPLPVPVPVPAAFEDEPVAGAPLVPVEWSGDERELLSCSLGTADPQEIVRMVADLRTRLETLSGLEAMLGSMEMALETLDS